MRGLRLRSSLAGIFLAIVAQASFGSGQALAAYYNTCSSGATDNQHSYLDKTSISVHYAVAEVPNLKLVHTCSGSPGGSSWVLPINIQGNGMFMQVGYGQVGTGGSATNHWYWTNNDRSGGQLSAISWPDPVAGHDYYFKVYDNNSSRCLAGGFWVFELYDLTTGWNSYGCASRYSGLGGTELWSGFEVWNSNDQMGGAGSAQYITDIGYSPTGATYTYFTSTTVYQGCCVPYAWHSYWHSAANLDAYNHARIYAYTGNH